VQRLRSIFVQAEKAIVRKKKRKRERERERERERKSGERE